MLRGKRDHRRRAAKRRRDGRAIEVVGADDARRGALLDMAMAVDAAGQYQLPARLDLDRTCGETLAECGNDAVLDPDIAHRRVGRRRHRAVADHQIVIAHAGPPCGLQRLSVLWQSSAAVGWLCCFCCFCSEISVNRSISFAHPARPSALLDRTWNTNIMAILVLFIR